jgi:hypothetical protein
VCAVRSIEGREVCKGEPPEATGQVAAATAPQSEESASSVVMYRLGLRAIYLDDLQGDFGVLDLKGCFGEGTQTRTRGACAPRPELRAIPEL